MSHAYDKRGLIRESYRIEGINASQCRSIFLDWAIGASDEPAQHEQIAALLAFYGNDMPDHPMSAVLRDGLERAKPAAGRRGGRRARVSGGEAG